MELRQAPSCCPVLLADCAPLQRDPLLSQACISCLEALLGYLQARSPKLGRYLSIPVALGSEGLAAATSHPSL